MGEMKNVPNEKKKEFGQILNEFKQFTEAKYEELKSRQSTVNIDRQQYRPNSSWRYIPVGTRHPISLMTNRIISIFQRLGFAVAEGPEIEDDWHNFTALNLPSITRS
jgi:phenylalanyl-tRNA synthetase alpha chain